MRMYGLCFLAEIICQIWTITCLFFSVKMCRSLLPWTPLFLYSCTQNFNLISRDPQEKTLFFWRIIKLCHPNGNFLVSQCSSTGWNIRLFVSDSHILLEKACGCHLAKALSFLQLSWPSTLLPSARQIWLSWRTQWMSGRRWHFQSKFQRRIAEQYDILKCNSLFKNRPF